MSRQQVLKYLKSFKTWSLSPSKKAIRRELQMKDFMSAIRFINRIAALAEKEGHHPDIHLSSYRSLMIEVWTHAIDGLSENDFILAAKIDRLPKKIKR